MLSEYWDKLYPYIFKNPCKICLVQATCKGPEPWQRKTCDTKNKWRRKRYKVEVFLNNVEIVLFGTVFIVGIVLTFATFILGFWKWYDIGSMIFK